MDANATQAGERNAAQVLSCSFLACMIAVRYRIVCGDDRRCSSFEESPCDHLIAAFVAFFACCGGDTFASELGTLSRSPPRLITQPWRTVPPGTNGGVTVLGTLASGLGGLVIGVVHAVAGFVVIARDEDEGHELRVLAVLGLTCGLVGSILDSVLGALFQKSLYDGEKKCIASDDDTRTDLVDVTGGRPWLSNHAVNFVSAAMTTALGPPLAVALRRHL